MRFCCFFSPFLRGASGLCSSMAARFSCIQGTSICCSRLLVLQYEQACVFLSVCLSKSGSHYVEVLQLHIECEFSTTKFVKTNLQTITWETLLSRSRRKS